MEKCLNSGTTYTHKRIASKGEINLKELYKLERRLATLEEENAIFRKSGYGKKSTNEEKIAAVKALKGEFTEYALCRTLGLSKATYYRSQNKTETWFDKKNEELRPAIKRVFEESREHPLPPESQTFYSRTNIWTRRASFGENAESTPQGTLGEPIVYETSGGNAGRLSFLPYSVLLVLIFRQRHRIWTMPSRSIRLASQSKGKRN